MHGSPRQKHETYMQMVYVHAVCIAHVGRTELPVVVVTVREWIMMRSIARYVARDLLIGRPGVVYMVWAVEPA